MGDKNPKKQKKKKRVVDKIIIAPLPTDKNMEREQKSRPKNQSRGR